MHADIAKPWKRKERMLVVGMVFGPRAPQGSQESPISIGFIRFRGGAQNSRIPCKIPPISLCFNKGFVKAQEGPHITHKPLKFAWFQWGIVKEIRIYGSIQ